MLWLCVKTFYFLSDNNENMFRCLIILEKLSSCGVWKHHKMKLYA